MPDEDRQSPHFFYVCAHGASNDPCPEHFPGQAPMPDNWMDDYAAPGSEGLTDAVDTS